MTELLHVPLKKCSEVDVNKPLKTLISSTYSTADKPEDYVEAVAEFQLHRNRICKNLEKSDASLDTLGRYYDLIVCLEQKINAAELQIPFKVIPNQLCLLVDLMILFNFI